MLEVLRKVFDAIISAIAYFTSRSAATKEAERIEKATDDAQNKVATMSDAAVRDELRKYARDEEGGASETR